MKVHRLSDRDFARLSELSAQQAASALLASGTDADPGVVQDVRVGGDDHLAMAVVWATWEFVVGGTAGHRPQPTPDSEATAQFLQDVHRVLCDGTAEPAVPVNDAWRNHIRDYASRSIASRSIHAAAASVAAPVAA